MTISKSSIKTTAALPPMSYAQATQLRVAAEKRHAAAIIAIADAKKADAALKERIMEGDDTVTAADMTATHGDIERYTLLSVGAANAIVKAKAVEAPLCSEHWSEILAELLDPLAKDLAQEKATACVAAALTELTEATNARNAKVRKATSAAIAASLPEYSRSSLRVGLHLDSLLMLDKAGVGALDLLTVLREALVDGAAAAGLVADGEYGKVRIRTKAQLAF